MPRNLFERCEVVFPVTQPDLLKRLRDQILAAYLADNTKARLLKPDGEYVRAPQTGAAFSAQDFLMRVAEGTADALPGQDAPPKGKAAPAGTALLSGKN